MAFFCLKRNHSIYFIVPTHHYC